LFVRDADKARELARTGGDPADAVVEVDADEVTLDQSAFSNGSVDFEVDGDHEAVEAVETVEVEETAEAEEAVEVEPEVEDVAEVEPEVEEVEEVEGESPFSSFVPAPGFEAPKKRGPRKRTQ
jgi:hypothetical protein